MHQFPTIKFNLRGVQAFNADVQRNLGVENYIPAAAIRLMAMLGVDCRGYVLQDAAIDEGADTVLLTLIKPPIGATVDLPFIPYTDANFHPLHGPMRAWWDAMQGHQGDPFTLHPLVVAEVANSLGGLDLTGIKVRRVVQGAGGYVITVDRDALSAIDAPEIQLTDESALQVAKLIENPPPFNDRLTKAIDAARTGKMTVRVQNRGAGIGEAPDCGALGESLDD